MTLSLETKKNKNKYELNWNQCAKNKLHQFEQLWRPFVIIVNVQLQMTLWPVYLH